jgi:hypothetical protein
MDEVAAVAYAGRNRDERAQTALDEATLSANPEIATIAASCWSLWIRKVWRHNRRRGPALSRLPAPPAVPPTVGPTRPFASHRCITPRRQGRSSRDRERDPDDIHTHQSPLALTTGTGRCQCPPILAGGNEMGFPLLVPLRTTE